MAQSSPAKFTFDLDLAQVDKPTRMFSEQEVDEKVQDTEQKSYAKGFDDGQSGQVAQHAASLARAVDKLAEQAAALVGAFDRTHNQLQSEAVNVAATVGRKLAHQLVDKYPTAELEQLIRECLASLERAPHLVVRCHPELADKVREIAEARMLTSGFEGRLVVMGDPEIEIGDGRLEWVDGGLVRDMSELDQEIEQRIANWLSAHETKPLGENK